MTNRLTDLSLRQTALLGGIGFVFLLMTSVFGKMFVPNLLLVVGDSAATIDNILASEGLFRGGIFASLLNYGLDILIALVFYVLLRDVNQSIALLSAWMRVVYSTIAAVGILFHLLIWQLATNPIYQTSLGVEPLHGLVQLFLFGHDYGWIVAYLFFGLHLLIAGVLALKSSILPKSLSVFLVLGGVGWIIHSAGHLLIPGYAENQVLTNFVAYMAAISEFYLMGWCLWIGLRREQRVANVSASYG